MASPSNPFDELDRLFDQLQRNVEEAARWWETDQSAAALPSVTDVNVDLEDRDDELVLTADLPGFDADDIDVRVTDRTLQLSAEHEETEETEAEEGEYIRRERHRRSVSRRVSLPRSVDTDEIEADYQNGVLTVTLPTEAPESDGIEVEIE